ncbi:MAG: TRIC cation channel family protein [Actinomycetota bacterium]|nr:TRIC cation channel family protein [Actinomycetota bacterium]
MDLELLVILLDLAGTFAFALVGARVAANKGLDYGGIAFVAAIASLAGGTLRNLLLGERPPWVLHGWLFLGVLLAVTITLSMRRTTAVGRFVLTLDTIGLAVSSVSGAQFALTQGAPFASAVILGLIGAVTGGLLRDVLCQVEPVLLHRETIGTSCLAGSLVYVSCDYFGVNQIFSVVLASGVVILVRELSIKFDWHLPKVGGRG